MKSLPDNAVIILGCLVSCSGLFVFPISLFGLSILRMELGRTYVSQQFTDLRPEKNEVLHHAELISIHYAYACYLTFLKYSFRCKLGCTVLFVIGIIRPYKPLLVNITPIDADQFIRGYYFTYYDHRCEKWRIFSGL